jgi:hypothetical protein
MDKGAKKKLNPIIKSSLIYTKPNRKNKIKSNTYVIKKKANGKVVAHKVGKMKEERGWNQPIWVPKEVIINMKGLKWFGFQRPLEGLEYGDLGGLAQRRCEGSSLEAKLASWTCVAQVPRLSPSVFYASFFQVVSHSDIISKWLMSMWCQQGREEQDPSPRGMR